MSDQCVIRFHAPFPRAFWDGFTQKAAGKPEPYIFIFNGDENMNSMFFQLFSCRLLGLQAMVVGFLNVKFVFLVAAHFLCSLPLHSMYRYITAFVC